MDKNMELTMQETKKELGEMFAHADSRCVEMAIKGCGDTVSISAGYTSSVCPDLESSYFMVTGENMFPEYVRGMDSLAELVCGYDRVIREQKEHISDGFYMPVIREGHPCAIPPECCIPDELYDPRISSC